MTPTQRSRTHIRLVMLAIVVAAAVFVMRRERSGAGFATAADCLDAYCEAGSHGDVTAYLACLEPSLRERMQQRFPSADELAEHLRREMGGIKSWVQLPETNDNREAVITVEEVRSAGQRRVRYRLVRAGSTWRIAAIEAPQDVPVVVPYGTPVSGT